MMTHAIQTQVTTAMRTLNYAAASILELDPKTNIDKSRVELLKTQLEHERDLLPTSPIHSYMKTVLTKMINTCEEKIK